MDKVGAAVRRGDKVYGEFAKQNNDSVVCLKGGVGSGMLSVDEMPFLPHAFSFFRKR